MKAPGWKPFMGRALSASVGPLLYIGIPAFVLYFLTHRHYPFFPHYVAQMLGVVISAGVFMLAWNGRRFLDNHYFLFLGISCLFVGIIDGFHALAFDGWIGQGGLVKERKSLDRTGLPWLHRIPMIGWLFGSRSDSVSRNELLIFITPRVIRSVEEGVQLSRDFEQRVAQLKARMGETKGIRLKDENSSPPPEPADRVSPGETQPETP